MHVYTRNCCTFFWLMPVCHGTGNGEDVNFEDSVHRTLCVSYAANCIMTAVYLVGPYRGLAGRRATVCVMMPAVTAAATPMKMKASMTSQTVSTLTAFDLATTGSSRAGDQWPGTSCWAAAVDDVWDDVTSCSVSDAIFQLRVMWCYGSQCVTIYNETKWYRRTCIMFRWLKSLTSDQRRRSRRRWGYIQSLWDRVSATDKISERLKVFAVVVLLVSGSRILTHDPWPVWPIQICWPIWLMTHC